MDQQNKDYRGLKPGLAVGVMVVFAGLVIGSCLLVVFLYNLPIIFPPPSQSGSQIGLATIAPPPSLLPPSAIPTWTPVASPSRTPTRVPAAALPSGQVVFVTERLGFNSIFLSNPDGSGQRLLVPHNGNYYDYAPAVSPNGRQIAFSSNRDKPGTDNIYVMNMDGSGLTKITSTPGSKNASASWFPDSQHLAFSSNRTGRWQVFTMDRDGSNIRQVISDNQDIINVAVSPNGSLLAYTCGGEVCIADADGSDPHVLLKNGAHKDHLSWSPDSNFLSFSQSNTGSGKTSIYVLDMQGYSRQLIANGGWANWSPDGKQLVFSSDMDGTANLYFYNLDSGEVSRVTWTNSADVTPVWVR